MSLIRHSIRLLFPALTHRNYRIFFVAQCISLTGSWMQRVALGYLVFQMTGSPLMVGVIDAATRLPSTFFALFGGTLVDRYPKRDILRLTQTLQFIVASVLGAMVITGNADLWTIGIMVFILGTVEAVDQPARLSLPVELVGKEHVQEAVAMNMSVFNSARIVGPAIAGWLIYAFGPGWAFLINGLSFIVPIIAFNLIQFKPFVAPPYNGTLRAIREGLSYTFHHQEIRVLLVYSALIGIFGWSYNTILPVVAEVVYGTDAAGLGLMFSFVGFGAVLGAVSVSAIGRFFDPHKLVRFGSVVFGLSLALFPWIPFAPALVALFCVGFGQSYQNSTIQARIQNLVVDRLRGRVSSIQSMFLQGTTPLGSLQIGIAASLIGSPMALSINALVVLSVSLVLYHFLRHIHHKHRVLEVSVPTIPKQQLP